VKLLGVPLSVSEASTRTDQQRWMKLRRVEPQHYTALIITPRQLRAVFVSTGPRRLPGG
jgi:hypothetical protein